MESYIFTCILKKVKHDTTSIAKNNNANDYRTTNHWRHKTILIIYIKITIAEHGFKGMSVICKSWFSNVYNETKFKVQIIWHKNNTQN